MSHGRKRARWSIRRRVTMRVAASVSALLVLGGGFVAWFMYDALQRELDLLAVEELSEFTVLSQAQPLDGRQLEQVLQALQAQHAVYALSLRVWRAGATEPWVIAGPLPASAWPPEPMQLAGVPEPLTPVQRLIAHRFPVRERLADGGVRPLALTAELFIDGRARAEGMLRVGSLFLALAIGGGVLSIAGGALFAGRVARLLRQVAESAELASLEAEGDISTPAEAPDEIRAVADAFRRSVERMREVHARNVLLTAGLAHEFRAPLQNMIAEAEIGLLRERTPEHYREILSHQLDEGRSLALVVDNLITLTSLRDPEGLARTERFDFGTETSLRLNKERVEAERRGIEILVEASGDLAFHGDREALMLMLRNLVGNAVRWTPDGSRVAVELVGDSQALSIVVADEGPGVAPGEREAIFEPFHQGPPPADARAGYGLGLALARTAARRHGGDIQVTSTPGGGARFEVRLPR